MPLSIGLDLDNTLICYDRAFLVAARERSLVGADFTGAKEIIRDKIRLLEDGETHWQKLQGYVYGAGIGNAQLFDGVMPFLKRAKTQGAQLFIVSHKTELGHFDATRTNLRDAAKAFLKEQGVMDYIPESQIFFASTREEKIAKITALGVDVFVDDLEEIFADPAFPPSVRKLLFSSNPLDKSHGFTVCSDWPMITQRILDEARNA
jgi:hypothetical protein